MIYIPSEYKADVFKIKQTLLNDDSSDDTSYSDIYQSWLAYSESIAETWLTVSDYEDSEILYIIKINLL
jgi:TRAP-type mannitol/chloroaromatic compound transport system substrate-binding protein